LSRIDKYDSKDGGFRAPLAEDMNGDEVARAVGLDATGAVVVGEGNTGIVGVLVLTSNKRAGDIVDVMTDGELVEFDGDPGTVYGTDPAVGTIVAPVPAAGTRLGHTVEGSRLIVRVAR